jgi:hypothetical protein
MSRKYDEIFNKMKDELEGGTPNPKPEETPQPEVTPTEEQPKAPEETPPPDPKTEETPHEVKEGDEQKTEQEPRQIPDDPLKRAEFSFKRQLAKSREKHEKELAERDAKYNELAKKFDELEKKMAPKEAKKTRENFENDDEYIDYLVELRMKALNSERDEELAKRESERAEKEKAAQEEQAELQQRQNAWLENVDNAFAHDTERTKKFIAKVQYANRNGLGEILDQCPVASDYLINDPNGPKVFERMLDDPQVFRRVFNPQRTSPMAIYWELKQVEQEISTAPNVAPSQAKKPIPKMGKPGRQAGGSTLMGDMFDDPRQVKKWLKEHR